MDLNETQASELFRVKNSEKALLLLALSNSDSHGDGSADHGVVAHRKVHIFNVFSSKMLLFRRIYFC